MDILINKFNELVKDLISEVNLSGFTITQVEAQTVICSIRVKRLESATRQLTDSTFMKMIDANQIVNKIAWN